MLLFFFAFRVQSLLLSSQVSIEIDDAKGNFDFYLLGWPWMIDFDFKPRLYGVTSVTHLSTVYHLKYISLSFYIHHWRPFFTKNVYFITIFIFHSVHLCSWSRVELKSLRLEARKFWLVQIFERFFRRLVRIFLDLFQNPTFGFFSENYLIYIINH